MASTTRGGNSSIRKPVSSSRLNTERLQVVNQAKQNINFYSNPKKIESKVDADSEAVIERDRKSSKVKKSGRETA